MDVNIFLTISQHIFVFFAIIGFASFSYLLINLLKNLIHYAKYKEYCLTSNEKRLFLLQEENKRLNERINELESHRETIVQNLINNLQ